MQAREADRVPQFHLWYTAREGRGVPYPNCYSSGDGDGVVDTAGETGKANGGGPVRAGGGSREAYHGTRGDRKHRVKALVKVKNLVMVTKAKAPYFLDPQSLW